MVTLCMNLAFVWKMNDWQDNFPYLVNPFQAIFIIPSSLVVRESGFSMQFVIKAMKILSGRRTSRWSYVSIIEWARNSRYAKRSCVWYYERCKGQNGSIDCLIWYEKPMPMFASYMFYFVILTAKLVVVRVVLTLYEWIKILLLTWFFIVAWMFHNLCKIMKKVLRMTYWGPYKISNWPIFSFLNI